MPGRSGGTKRAVAKSGKMSKRRPANKTSSTRTGSNTSRLGRRKK